jgi:glycosyltransferase involved in cell wall biosynthesis
MGDTDDKFSALYDTCRNTPGIEYVGPVPQPQLARELKAATLLAYSNSFAETACVAMMEAMASGCMIVSSDLGSLPETTAGYAKLLKEPPKSAEYEAAFVKTVVESLREVMGSDRDDVEKHLQEQVAYCHQTYRWEEKVTPWIQWFEKMAS